MLIVMLNPLRENLQMTGEFWLYFLAETRLLGKGDIVNMEKPDLSPYSSKRLVCFQAFLLRISYF